MSTPAPSPSWNTDAVERLARAAGGRVVVDAVGPAIDVGRPALPDGAAFAVLPDVGLLAVSGDEAAKFLHTQLTNDVEHLVPGQARWGGYCSVKGRLQATFRYWRDPAAIHLTVARPLAGWLARRLSMFVLRTKAKVLDTSDAHAVFGLVGHDAGSAAAAAFGLGPPPQAEGSVSSATGHLVGLPPVGERAAERPRWLLVVADADAERAVQAIAASAVQVDTVAWRRTEVLAGIPRIVPGTFEQFVPQMLNFESVDGVNFRKGCYPGQEVVARSQYLGKLKRRMFLAHGAGAVPIPGSDIVPAAGGDPVGQVVLAAPDARGGFDLLFESQVAAVEAGALRAGDAVLDVRPLPYALKAID